MNRLAVVLSTLLALSPVLYREGIDLNTHSIDSSIVTINEVAVTPTDEPSVDNTEVTDDAEEELEVKESLVEVSKVDVHPPVVVDYTQYDGGEDLVAPKIKEVPEGLRYYDPYDYADSHLTREGGVCFYNGHKETWYSIHEAGQTVTARDIPDKHIAADGTIRDKDGYICVATNQDFYQYGDVIELSIGIGKVYDCGCAYGTVDVYTNW